MSYKIIVSRVFLPAAVVCTVAEYKCKPSELPIYMPDLDSKTWKGNCPNISEIASHQPPTLVEEAVGSIRKQLVSVCTEIAAYKQSAGNVVDSCIDQAAWLRNYLADENNVAPKPGAISIGALTGFLFGLKGGLVRRVCFTGAGALAMAAVCYPRQAADYSMLGLTETKKYVTIGYNFIYGVKKGDPPLELPTPPTTVDEAWVLVRSTGSRAISLLYSTISSVIAPIIISDPIIAGNKSAGSDNEVDMAALLLLDPNLDPTFPRSQNVIEKLHDDAAQSDYHCPVGLSPHTEDEGSQTGKSSAMKSSDGENVIVHGGDECCACICDDEDYE